MKRSPKGRLELTWMGKDSALIPSEEGKYDYAFVDPDDPRAREVKSIGVLEQVGEVDGPTGANENLLIVGDSGDALRSLATIPEYHEKYAGQVKLVYIDPPFNTEKTFEHYADSLEHSIWLTMIRDRIHALRPLLEESASVWVHLNDSEVHRMRCLLDEEFGSDHFVSQLAWEKGDSPRMDAEQFSERHDTILVYANSLSWKPNKGAGRSDLSFPLVDANGRAYRAPGPLRKWGATSDRSDRPNLWYPLTAPNGEVVYPIKPNGREGYWRWKREVAEARAEDLHWEDKGSGMQPYVKEYEDSQRRSIPPESWWPNADAGHNREAKAELKALFPGEVPFSTPKPERLLQKVISIASSPGDLVLDFFLGSGTTAAVAHKMRRRWLGVELQYATAMTFVKPRLTRVVQGRDAGGVTSATERVAVGDLPTGVTPEEAQRFNSTLTKLVKSAEDLDPATIRALREITKTRDARTTVWEGGGGFTVAKIGPSMYEVDDEDGEVYLSPEATNGAWSKAIAGQLKFTLTPDHPVFAGVRNRQRLAVIDGVADATVVRTVVEALGDRERAVIVAKGVLPEAAELLSALSPGSLIKKAPEDIFPKGTVN